MDAKQIEQLLNSPDGVTPAPVVKAALEEVQKREKEKQVKETIARLEIASNNTVQAVQALKNARKVEKTAKVYLDAISKAENSYTASGDWQAYSKAVDQAVRDRYNSR